MAINRFSPPPDDARYVDAATRIDQACGIIDAEGNPRHAPAPANLFAIHRTTGVSRIMFRNVPYDVPPTGYEHGLHLLHLRAKYLEASLDAQGNDRRRVRQALQDLVSVLEAMVAIFRRSVRPVRWRDRIRWHWPGFNPFAKCEREEVDMFIAFFLSCQTRCNVRISLAIATGAAPTWPTILQSSLGNIRRGAIQRRARRARGRTM